MSYDGWDRKGRNRYDSDSDEERRRKLPRSPPRHRDNFYKRKPPNKYEYRKKFQRDRLPKRRFSPYYTRLSPSRKESRYSPRGSGEYGNFRDGDYAEDKRGSGEQYQKSNNQGHSNNRGYQQCEELTPFERQMLSQSDRMINAVENLEPGTKPKQRTLNKLQLRVNSPNVPVNIAGYGEASEWEGKFPAIPKKVVSCLLVVLEANKIPSEAAMKVFRALDGSLHEENSKREGNDCLEQLITLLIEKYVTKKKITPEHPFTQEIWDNAPAGGTKECINKVGGEVLQFVESLITDSDAN